jgi:hypothetical protein
MRRNMIFIFTITFVMFASLLVFSNNQNTTLDLLQNGNQPVDQLLESGCK